MVVGRVEDAGCGVGGPAVGEARGRAAYRRRHGPAGEVEQVVAFVAAQTQLPGEGGQGLLRGLGAAVALQRMG